MGVGFAVGFAAGWDVGTGVFVALLEGRIRAGLTKAGVGVSAIVGFGLRVRCLVGRGMGVGVCLMVGYGLGVGTGAIFSFSLGTTRGGMSGVFSFAPTP